MKKELQPKLRSVERHKSLYPLNRIPDEIGFKIGKELIYLLATRENPDIAGNDWEQIFARCLGVEWKNSNVGLEDVTMGQTAWSAKTVKLANPFNAKHIRLISGRNSLDYSYDVKNVHERNPAEIGGMVLGIWNKRYEKVGDQFRDLRTIILIREEGLRSVAVFEIKSLPFDPQRYYWEWNQNNNLDGYEVGTDKHRFVWQPHGSQFTVKVEVPDERLKIRVRKPPMIGVDQVMNSIKFDSSWIELVS